MKTRVETEKRRGFQGPPGPVSGLGQNLKRLREESGLSVRELAAACGWKSHTIIAKLETGRSASITRDRLLELARALRCTMADLLPMDDDGTVVRQDPQLLAPPPLAARPSRSVQSPAPQVPATRSSRPGDADWVPDPARIPHEETGPQGLPVWRVYHCEAEGCERVAEDGAQYCEAHRNWGDLASVEHQTEQAIERGDEAAQDLVAELAGRPGAEGDRARREVLAKLFISGAAMARQMIANGRAPSELLSALQRLDRSLKGK